MPQVEPLLTSTYRGRTFDVTKAATDENWFDQGGPHPRKASGLPRKQRLWLYSFMPGQRCGDHQFELILFVSLTPTGKVRQVRSAVYRSYSPRAIEEMAVEMFPHDLEHATEALEEVLAPEVEPRRRRRAPRDGLDVAILARLVGKSIRNREPHELVRRFRLARASGERGGFRYAAARARLQVETDGAGRITGLVLTPTLGDRLLEKPLELEGKPLDAIRRGHVRAALGLPTEASQRPDFDRFEYGDREVRFSYAPRGGGVAAVRIASVPRAC